MANSTSCTPIEELADIVKETAENGTPIEELLPDEYKEKHSAAIKEFADDKDDESTEEESLDEKKKIRVKITKYLGSKGLSALHTIIIGLKNGVFPRNPKAITDDEICKFVVALTRAKKSCLLITNPKFNLQTKKMVRNPSIFFDMFPEDNLEVFQAKIKKGY